MKLLNLIGAAFQNRAPRKKLHASMQTLSRNMGLTHKAISIKAQEQRLGWYLSNIPKHHLYINLHIYVYIIIYAISSKLKHKEAIYIATCIHLS